MRPSGGNHPNHAFAPRFVRGRAVASISTSRPSFVGNFSNVGRLETPSARRCGCNLSIDWLPTNPAGLTNLVGETPHFVQHATIRSLHSMVLFGRLCRRVSRVPGFTGGRRCISVNSLLKSPSSSRLVRRFETAEGMRLRRWAGFRPNFPSDLSGSTLF